MFVKNLLHKAIGQNLQHGNIESTNQGFQVVMHYGIPYTASILAFDAIQRILAIGTLDGRIKIIGGDNIEGLLISTKKLPYKYLQFLENKGLIIGVSNENDIQVWDLQCRKLSYSLEWEVNITAFAVINGTYFMYVGDENGLLSVLKYDFEEGKLSSMPYNIPANTLSESIGVSIPNQRQIVGILPQPGSSGARVLILYENGAIVLWDIIESQAIAVRSSMDLQLKIKEFNDSPLETSDGCQDTPVNEPEEKEICSVCWASNSGSVIAVGYIDGDILLWDLSVSSSAKGKETAVLSKNVVKLQLSSGERRLPVIVLHWAANAKANNDKGGQLFIYGGDDMGSEEVISILSLEWSTGIDTVRCISRAELNLDGSFADMILVPDARPATNNSTAALFVLTNPGQINVYDGAMLGMLKSVEGVDCAQPEKFPVVVPTVDPAITITRLCLLPTDKSAKVSFKKTFAKRNRTPTLPTGAKWPLTGGVPNEATVSDVDITERLYIAGYQDGSVRIWDATHPILTLMFVLDGKIPAPEVDGQRASISALDFSPLSMSLIVGNEFGLVRVYTFHSVANRSNIHLVNGNKHDVHPVYQGEGFHSTAIFTLGSPIRAMKFANCGNKFAVGLESGQVLMLDMSSHATLFQTSSLSSSSSQVITVFLQVVPQINTVIGSPKNSRSENQSLELLFTLTKDGQVSVVDSTSGIIINSRPMSTKKARVAISMYVIDAAVSETFGEKHMDVDYNSSKSDSRTNEDPNGTMKQRFELTSSGSSNSSELLSDPLLVICYEEAVRLYSFKSLIQGDGNCNRKVKLGKRCCWSTIFKKRDEKSCGLVLLYQTGDLEIRSLPDLEVIAGSSLMSILRWSFKTNMEKIMSSYDNGQITMVSGSEIAFLSLLGCENEFRYKMFEENGLSMAKILEKSKALTLLFLRIPKSLPCLHDKVLAAAADAATNLSASQKKKQDSSSRILGGFIKGIKGGKTENSIDIPDNIVRSNRGCLEDCFLKDPFSEPSVSTLDSQELELSIDDIEIDDNPPASSSSYNVVLNTSDTKKNTRKGENKEREKLFDGSTNDVKPRVRTTQEILTQYKFGGDAAAAAAHARDKLSERQEKLERIRKNTEELQSGAENFAALANELVRTMESKKWWKL